MKTLALVFTLSSLAWAKDCPKDHIDGPAGACTAYMPRALGASQEESAKWVSDEAPPKDKMPSYQREGVKTVDAPPTGADDIKQDQQAQEANAIGQAACEKKYGKGQCGDRGKSPEPHTVTLKGTATPQ